MKAWKCVVVSHHKNMGKVIENWEQNGWCLHTYQAVGPFMGGISHYLLFEKVA